MLYCQYMIFRSGFEKKKVLLFMHVTTESNILVQNPFCCLNKGNGDEVAKK